MRSVAGRLRDGTVIEAVTLSNARGVSARILTLGATLQALIAPDVRGTLADVILGHDDVAGYEAARGFLGVTIGRYANRIAGGRFTLDGTPYSLSRNDGRNALHGGATGFDQAVWAIASIRSDSVAAVALTMVSPDGDNGFPGEVTATVIYSLDDAGDLGIDFAATTTRPTIVNLTHHAVFDLGGDQAPVGAAHHVLTIAATRFTPVDAQLIPTGELRPVAGSVFDFRSSRLIGDGLRDGGDEQIVIGRGYDHNFVLDKGRTRDPIFCARLDEPVSGRRLEVLSTEPGLQLYTGNAFDGAVRGKGSRLYRMGDGIALEPQQFPDTPNRAAFGSARIDPGELYQHRMIYRLSVIG